MYFSDITLQKSMKLSTVAVKIVSHPLCQCLSCDNVAIAEVFKINQVCENCYFSYYPALKTLEQLEHTYLPRVSKYRFSQAMCETIPKMRDSIKTASMSDLKDFLENIRRHSAHIGEIAMKQVRALFT